MANAVTEHTDGSDVVVSGLSGRLPESDNIEEFARQLFAGADLVTTDGRRWTPGCHYLIKRIEYRDMLSIKLQNQVGNIDIRCCSKVRDVGEIIAKFKCSWAGHGATQSDGVYGLPKRNGKLKDIKHFDAMFFGVHAKQAHRMDPEMRLLMEVVHETFVDAGLSPVELRGSRTGVYAAVAGSESERLWYQDINRINGYELLGCSRHMFANRLSYTFDLKGPSCATDTACSSSLSAFTQAVNAIHAGDCDAAVVAGSNICLDPSSSVHFQRLNVLSQEGRCAVFDANASGYVRSEAVVAVLLQRRCNARRVYCTVRGARMNNDGYKVQGITYPDGDMHNRLTEETYEKARLRPQDVVYVEAHGTGTMVGDPEEANAIAELFCKDRLTPLLLGAVKSNMGHAEVASGLCSIAKIILAMERGVVPGNLHYNEPNPNIPALRDGRIKVVDKNTAWRGGLVGVNSFGFGGSNAHVIVSGGCGSRPPPAEYLVPRLVLASGRTDDAVERLLRLATEHPRDAELHALIDAVHASAIPNHPRRGFTVLDSASPVFEVRETVGEPRPVWFVFSGMGSQLAGMARGLLYLPVFAASIARMATALEPYGVDLRFVIAEAPDTAFDNIINSLVSITAVQVALVDVLRQLNVHHNGIIGHSLGEIGCAYADGALTAEQAVLCAYWRGRCTLEARPAPGVMATVGLSWEEAARRCPQDVHCACHNSLDNVTVRKIMISGPPVSVTKFVDQLSAEGVFVKMIDTGNIAFHSTYVAGVGPLLRARLQEVIREPKPRSARWLSSSVPQNQWNSALARLSDAEYHVNNFLSPVRFASVLASVPAHALVVEIAPHALLQAVLKRTLPSAAHVPLVQRDAPNALVHLLTAMGKIFVNGVQPQVSRLYPAVSWPVSRGTPGLASHVGWDHSIEWSVADFRTAGRNIIEYDLSNLDEAFMAGHNIDGRILFPVTGYLMMVWRTLAKMNWLDIEQAAIVLENVQFRRDTIMPKNMPLRFLVSVLESTGEFEVCEGGSAVVTGTARLTDAPATECLPLTAQDEGEENQEEDLPLESEDIYKEFRLRGYNYEGLFRGIKSSDAHGTRGLLKWEGNWISFMDTVLQFGLIGTNTRALHVTTSLQHIVIDPAAQRKAVTDGAVSVKRYRNIDVIASGGVEFRGFGIALAPRQNYMRTPSRLEKYVFVPYENSQFSLEDHECTRRNALTVALQLVIENCGSLQLKLAELALQRPVGELLLPCAMQVLAGEPQVRTTATLIADTKGPQYATDMDPLQIKVSNKNFTERAGGFEANCHVVLGANILTRHDGMLRGMAAANGAAGFILLEERARALDDSAARAQLGKVGLVVVSRASAGSREYLLLRRASTIPEARTVIEACDDNYAWVDRLKDAMKHAESEDMRVYVWSRAACSGVLGLATCLRQEPGGGRLRLYYLPGATDAFCPDAPTFRKQVRRDLAFNVLRAGIWGTFRHLLLDDTANALVQVEHAYVHTLAHGDLSSLRWIESDLQYAAATPLRPNTDLCRVYYSSINFHDILFATGKLTSDSDRECTLGLEFSGYSSTGKRIMGMVPAKALATTVLIDKNHMWEVPEEWSLEEAATVPVAYLTAYYALCVRGRMRRGETVLVHAGAGGVGHAAIAVALHAGCTVFTTVGTPEKRAFLRERFPELLDSNIGNSRDCSFEQLVLHRTRGRGVDLVLNSLAGDMLQASLRCLAKCGRFLEIGKVDINANTALGMKVLLKNTIVISVMLDELLSGPDDNPEKVEVIRCIYEGIAAGAVRPLPTIVFAKSQLEQAFRYMATGQHIGKVLIRVREDETAGELEPTRFLSAIPRVYMHPDKSYVLVGGLGGFGLELGEWLVRRGARTLVLNSRGDVRTGYQAWCIRRWRLAGVHVLVSTADAATPAGAHALLQAATDAAPVGGIFNLAVVLRDALLENQTPATFYDVVKPKIDVTRELDAASRKLTSELDYFVAFSSLSCGRGNAGQSNYGLANSGMERLCEQRQADGLPALAVQWGAVGDVGLAAAMLGDKEEVGGTVPQSIASCLNTLETMLMAPHAVVASAVLADKRPVQEKLTQDLAQTIVNILGFKDLSKIPEMATLSELGMDSLMSAEIKQTLEYRYGVMLGVQEIRSLTFAKLRVMADEANDQTASTPASVTEASNNGFTDFSNIIPQQVLVKLPSHASASPEDRPIFMVHPIEGVIDMLRGLASCVRGTVYGLQCARVAPLDNMAALARFYVQRVRTTQPQPPYTLLGYSFGAAVAFEMALQLEQEGCKVELVLVDGSPAYVSSNTTPVIHRASTRFSEETEAGLLAYFTEAFFDLDSTKVVSELKQQPDWEARLDRVTEFIIGSGARVDTDTVRDAANALCRRLIIGDSYRPGALLRAPVTLFKAHDNHVVLDNDYGLKAVCMGEVRTRQLAGTHRTVLTGDSAHTIADHVSDLLTKN